MKHVIAAFLAVSSASLQGVTADEHWNQFRGPLGNGFSSAATLPVEFDEAKNVRWKIAIPDEGWSSPVVWGNEIWLTAGSDEKRELRAICVNLESGKIIKDIKVFDMIERKVDPAYAHDSPHLNSPATPTPVVEEDRVYVSFGSQGIACLDRKTGDEVWQRRDLRIYQPVRQGSSPIVDGQNLYVAYDGTDQQFFVALDKATGETRWKNDRNVGTDWAATLSAKGLSSKKTGGKPGDNKKSFATATLIESDGQRQLIAPAAEATISYDPATGEELWRALHPGGFNVAARPIYANGLVYVFTSGLTHHLMAIKPDGSGDVTDTHVAWSTAKSTPNIPSPVVVDDLLFMVTDKGGIARCLDAASGEEIWKKRLGGDHWASPLYAGGKLCFSSKQGDVTILPASREKPEILARNRMNARFIASPAVAGSSLILRSTTHLYCLTEGYKRSAAEVAKDTQSAESKVAATTDKEVDWDAAYAQLLKKDSGVRKKVESGGQTKEQVIAWMKARRGNNKAGAKGKPIGRQALAEKLKKAVRDGKMTAAEARAAFEKAATRVGGPGNKSGPINFYAVVIGRLKSKDIELGEFTLDVDYVASMYGNQRVKDEIVGKTVKVSGVSGQFLDNLLQIRRGQTLKVRSGSYLAESKTLTFAVKFHVLERTASFRPEDFGVPPAEFRGFRGELTGKIVEVSGYEMLLQVSEAKAADGSRAANTNGINGKRVRIVGFFNDHRETYADLHEGDVVRVSGAHENLDQDELKVTDVLKKLEK